MEVVTKEDLQLFRIQLLDDIKRIILTIPVKEEQEWLKSAEVRRLLKASAGTLQNLRITGKLHPKKIGGSWYYNSKDVYNLFKL